MPGITSKAVTGVVAAAVALAAVALLPEREQGPPTVHRSATAPAPYGPGAWTGAPDFPMQPFAALDTVAPAGPGVEADGSLRVDRALRDVLDHFLLGGHPGTRADHAAALRLHLNHLDAPAARAQAWELAQRYMAYLDEHDRLLSRVSAPAVHADSTAQEADVERIRAWLAQRTRLRQTMLGIDVARIWFDEEERALGPMLAALASGLALRQDESTAHEFDRTAQALSALHEQAATVEARRELISAQYGEDAARRFDALEQEEQAWQQRFAAYRRQAQALRVSATGETDREREIDALRMRLFPDEAQRLRAIALDDG